MGRRRQDSDPQSTLSTQREPPVTGVVTPQATTSAPSASVSAEATANPEGKASRAKKKRTTVNSNVHHTQLSADAKKAPTIKGPDANLLLAKISMTRSVARPLRQLSFFLELVCSRLFNRILVSAANKQYNFGIKYSFDYLYESRLLQL